MIVERLDPSETSDVGERELHLQRYRWAAPRVEGTRVLDAACGVGYGSAILAEGGACQVLGVDLDPASVTTARERHGSDRVRFEVADLTAAAGPLAESGAWDTVVSFETIEHLERPLAFLRRVHALLRPGGRLLLSAPVRERPGDNPYHLHCFAPDSLRMAVEEGFQLEETLIQAGGAYHALALRRRDEPAPAWREPEAGRRARVTVVLVAWNARSQVLELLRTLRGFTPPPYELLVLDNASSDGLSSALRLFQGEPGYRLVENRENRRCAAATNQALALVETEYVVYLCASHALVTGPEWLERLVEWMDAHPQVPLAGDVWAPGYALPSRRYRPGWSPERHQGPLLHVQGGAWIARRALFDEVGGFAEDEHPHSGMDVELSYRLLSLGKELGQCPLFRCPPSPQAARLEPGVAVLHPAGPEQRAEVLGRLGSAPALATAGEHPFARGWHLVHGAAWLIPGGVQVAATGPDSGVFSERAFRDLRLRARVRWVGVAEVKLRIASDHDPSADGYHVLLGGGTNYLARAGHVLARFSDPAPATDLTLEVQGSRLRLDLDGRRVAEVQDHALAQGAVLLGANAGQARFEEVTIEELG